MRQPFIEFVEEGRKYRVTEKDLVKYLGKEVESVPSAKKSRYGIDIVYQLGKDFYDSRDSGLVYGYISYFQLVKYLPLEPIK